MIRLIGFSALFFISFLAISQEDQRTKQPDIPGDIMIDFGWNLAFEDPQILKTNWWPSNSVGLYYMWTLKLNNKATINAAPGFTFEKFSIYGRRNYLLQPDHKYAWDTLVVGNIKKNKLAFTYADLPLELRLYPLKTIDGEGFFIGVGGMVGFRVDSHTKLKYRIDGSNKKQKLYGNFGMSDFRYGVVGRIGLKGINGFVKYYFSDIWRNGPGGANPRLFTVGINVTGF